MWVSCCTQFFTFNVSFPYQCKSFLVIHLPPESLFGERKYSIKAKSSSLRVTCHFSVTVSVMGVNIKRSQYSEHVHLMRLMKSGWTGETEERKSSPKTRPKSRITTSATVLTLPLSECSTLTVPECL